MKMKTLFILAFLTVCFISQAISQTHHLEPSTLAIGTKAPDFSLLGTDGKTYSLRDFDKSPVMVIIFSCNHCPTAQAYENRIIAIANDYLNKGVQVVMISSNDVKALNYSEMGYSDMGDSYEEMKQRATDKSFPFPYLYDGDEQKTALTYGPVATPHCFVFDNSRILRYEGRIDDSEKPGTANGEDLRNAIEATLAGHDIENPVTKVFGCSIKWSWKDEYTRKLYIEWAELPVTLEDADVAGIKELISNPSDKVRLINIWATWCGPCRMEFPDLVIIDRMYRNRSFEFITISADKPERKTEAMKFLQQQQASNRNYIFNKSKVYELMEAVDPEWKGALPYTLLIEPGGKILYRKQDMIDPSELRKLIVESKYLGRYY
jgi:thiol-disulfide isomerase/thioredoxin